MVNPIDKSRVALDPLLQQNEVSAPQKEQVAKQVTDVLERGGPLGDPQVRAAFTKVFPQQDVDRAVAAFKPALKRTGTTIRPALAEAFLLAANAADKARVVPRQSLQTDESPFCGAIIHAVPKGMIPGINAVDVPGFEKSTAHVHHQFTMIYEAILGDVTIATMSTQTGELGVHHLEAGPDGPEKLVMPPGTAYRVLSGSENNYIRCTCVPEFVDGDSTAWAPLDDATKSAVFTGPEVQTPVRAYNAAQPGGAGALGRVFDALADAADKAHVIPKESLAHGESPFSGAHVVSVPKGLMPGMEAVDVPGFQTSTASVHYESTMIYEVLVGELTVATQDVNTGETTLHHLKATRKEGPEKVIIPPGTAYRVVSGDADNYVRCICVPGFVDGDAHPWPELDESTRHQEG